MWTTNSLWFEIAIVSIVFAIGNMVMGHFEEQTPKLRRVGKYILVTTLICIVSVSFGRVAAMVLLGLSILPLLYIHSYYLPRKKGINGWTGEPKARYYQFRGWSMNIFNTESDDIKHEHEQNTNLQ
jgi:hypothetical protein